MKSTDLSFYIETLGCPKNVVDSRTMRNNLLQNGFTEETAPENADFILINTCSFVREAQENTIETIFNAVKIKNKKKNKKIGIIGCFTQQFADNLDREIPEADFFLGTQKYHQISSILSQKFSIELKTLKPGELVKSRTQNQLPYAYFRIAQGCSRKCAFCIIPTIRGRLESYSLENIERQFKEEITARRKDNPLREAIFVSQDTISTPLSDIQCFTEYFHRMDEISWIRLHYLFPDKRVFEIIDMMNNFPKVVPYLDIPFQHVSPKILQAMNRPDNPELFEEIISYGMQKNPDLEVRSAFIVGFPGETEKDIEIIADFLKNHPVHKAAFFRYSHEEGTAAFENFKDTIPEDEKAERINYLREVHIQTRTEQRKRWIGKKIQLMLDEINADEIIGRRPQDSPDIDEVVYLSGNTGNYHVGDIVEARLDTAMEYDWIGEIV